MKHRIKQELINQPLKRTFFKYVFLNVVSMLGVSLLILSDTFFVANGVGVDGIAALSMVVPMINIFNGVGWMLGVGGSTLFSIAKGQGNLKEEQEYFTLTIIFTLFLSLLFWSFALVFSDQILSFLGAKGHIFDLAKNYYIIIMAFSPLFILTNVFVSFLRNDDSPNLAMAGILAGALTNVALDYILVFPLGMGLAGAAIGTVVSPIISLAVFSLHLRSEDRKLMFTKFTFKAKDLVHVLSLGFSSLLNESASAVETFLFNIVLLQLIGNIGVSAYGILANMNIIIVAIFTGIGQGFQPLVSIYHGAHRYDKVKRTLRLAVITSVGVGIAIYFYGVLFPGSIAGIFNAEQNQMLEQLVVEGIPIYFISYLFVGITFTAIYFMADVDRARASFILSSLRGFILLIPTLLVFAQIGGLTGVWLTMGVVDFITALLAVYIMYVYTKTVLRESRRPEEKRVIHINPIKKII